MRQVPVAEAVGMILCHDITRIIPGAVKERAFRKGQMITEEDVPKLKDLGKENIFVWESSPDLVHENDAALLLAKSVSGPGLHWDEPNQGKVNLQADYDGLLKIQTEMLCELNSIEGIVLSTLHNNRVVTQDQVIAGTRVIPLTIKRQLLDEAEGVCAKDAPMLTIKPFQTLPVGIVTTGNEVYTGRIEDGFTGVVTDKVEAYGATVCSHVTLPDDADLIAGAIRRMAEEGAKLIITTGGMSVDPDDVTPTGIRLSGADVVSYGAPVLPGSMFMLAYLEEATICGLPGCVMYNKTTIFDLVLPRIFAGERLSKRDIVVLGQGGLCENCPECTYPACAFGKSS